MNLRLPDWMADSHWTLWSTPRWSVYLAADGFDTFTIWPDVFFTRFNDQEPHLISFLSIDFLFWSLAIYRNRPLK